MSKIVVVTGASTGIGRTAAQMLAQRGFRVYAGVRKPSDAKRIEEEGLSGLLPLMLDVTDEQMIAAAVKTVTEDAREEGIWGLVNNAGIAEAGPLEFLPLERFRRQFDVNVTGQVAVTQAFLPLLRNHTPPGRIVFVGSTNGYFSLPFVGAYAGSKYAIEGLVDALRRELNPWGISVSLVQPGAIATPIWDKSSEKADELEMEIPQRGHELYGEMIANVRATVESRTSAAIPPERVGKTIVHAMGARRPKLRYKVGLDAWLQWVAARLIPDRLIDWVAAKVLTRS